jgi:hypothetical protein
LSVEVEEKLPAYGTRRSINVERQARTLST